MTPAQCVEEAVAELRKRINRTYALEAMFEAQGDSFAALWCVIRRMDLRQALINLTYDA